jgi:hypothetical protein
VVELVVKQMHHFAPSDRQSAGCAQVKPETLVIRPVTKVPIDDLEHALRAERRRNATNPDPSSEALDETRIARPRGMVVKTVVEN